MLAELTYDIVDPATRAEVMALIGLDIGPISETSFASTEGDPLVDIVRYNPHAGVHPLSKMPIEHARDLPVAPGFAYPVNAATREPFSGPFSYLLSMADRGDRKDSGRWCENSNRTYAYLLRPVCEALVMEGRPSEYLDDDVMDLVVSSLLSGVNRRGQPLSPETIEQTIRATCRCVDHTNKTGETSITLEEHALLGRAYGLSTIYGRDGKRLDRDRLLGVRRHMIRPLSMATVDLIRAALPITAYVWEQGGPSSRPRMTFDTGRRCGFRVTENLGIHVDDVRAKTVVDADRQYDFILKRTKGADHREVVVQGRDVLAWQQYDRSERRHWMSVAREMHGSGWDEPVELFVNTSGAGRHVGEATQASSMQRDFRGVQIGLGMYKTINVAVTGAAPSNVTVLNHCYHDLRHTYARAMYDVACGSPEHRNDPVAFVCHRLGHSHPSTTSRIYLWPDQRKVAKVGDTARHAVRSVIDVR